MHPGFKDAVVSVFTLSGYVQLPSVLNRRHHRGAVYSQNLDFYNVQTSSTEACKNFQPVTRKRPMQKVDLPDYEWPEFFLNMATVYRNRIMNIKQGDNRDGNSVRIENVALKNIVMSDDGTRCIQMQTVDSAGKHLTHTIDSPLRIMMINKSNGLFPDFEIASTSGLTTTIEFK